MKQSLVLLLCILLCASCVAQGTAFNRDSFLNSQPFVDWAKLHALPLQNSDSALGDDDLRPLRKMIGNARVVALGEPAHGFHEPLATRNRLFRFLAEQCGFTAFVLEGDFARSHLASEFVSGGAGTAKEAAAKLSIAGASKENIELLEWMRKYNADPAHPRKLSFYGMDMELVGFPGDTTPAHAAIDEVLSYLKLVDAAEAIKMSNALAPVLKNLSVARYPKLSPEEHYTLNSTLDQLLTLFKRERVRFIGKSAAQTYEWAYRNIVVAKQTELMVQVMPPDEPGRIPPGAWRAVNVRDSSMADNVMWILRQQPPGGKVFVFAHNAHVKNEVTLGSVWDAFAQPPHATGQYLRSVLGNDLFIIGSSCAPSLRSAQPGSLDKALAQVGKPRYIVDLRPAAADRAVATWLSAKRPMEANTVGFLVLRVSQAFDAILFVDK